MVGGAELPVVKTLVFTSSFGIFGGGMSITGRLEATSIFGAVTSSSTLGLQPDFTNPHKIDSETRAGSGFRDLLGPHFATSNCRQESNKEV